MSTATAIDTTLLENPYRPGAGHKPPYLAGREKERADAISHFKQSQILRNIVLTGLRGVGKTVFLEELRIPAASNNFYWVGADLSESASISEEHLAIRLLTDLAVVTSQVEYDESQPVSSGFIQRKMAIVKRLDFQFLKDVYDNTPGLIVDKLKNVLELSWKALNSSSKAKGIIFAYDEAQNLADHAAKEQYPLSMLLDLFQSLQRKGVPFMLLLSGLPTLFPKLVEARTYAERMFHIITLHSLSPKDCRDAIVRPLENYPAKFTKSGIAKIIEVSEGYPYFVQFICRESFDLVLRGEKVDKTTFESIIIKLDNDFFAGRWNRATDRQQDLMKLIASLPNAEAEFSVQEIVEASKNTASQPFSSSHVNQILGLLVKAGLIYKNRHGKYIFAVPLLSHFIKRQPI